MLARRARERLTSADRTDRRRADKLYIMAIAEDKRRLAVRVTAFKVSCSVAFVLLGGGFWFFQIAPARQVQGDGGEQPPADAAAARAARRDLRSRGAGASSRTATRSTSRSSASTARISSARSSCCRRVTGVLAGRRCARSSRGIVTSRPTGPMVVINDATLAQVAAVIGAASGVRAAGRRRAGSADAPVPVRIAGRTLDWLRRRGQRRAGQRRRLLARHHRRTDRRREDLQRAADGRGRRAPRRRQQHRPRDPRARQGAAGRGPPRAADAQSGDAEGGRRGLPSLRLLGLGHRARSAQRRRAHAGEPAGLRSERVCRAASIVRRIRRSSPTSCGRCRTARFRAAIRRDRRSSWWSRRRRSKRA